MNHIRIESKLKELLTKFENGSDRYRRDVFFHNIINGLARGQDPLKALDIALDRFEKSRDFNTELLFSKPPEYSVTIDYDMIDPELVKRIIEEKEKVR